MTIYPFTKSVLIDNNMEPASLVIDYLEYIGFTRSATSTQHLAILSMEYTEFKSEILGRASLKPS